MDTVDYDWHTIAFSPAAPGWRIVCLDHTKHTTYEHPVAGWLTQEERAHEALSWRLLDPGDDPPANRGRRVVAGIVEDGEVVSAVDTFGYWYVAGPDDTDAPGQDEIDQEIAKRKAQAAKARAAREAKS